MILSAFYRQSHNQNKDGHMVHLWPTAPVSSICTKNCLTAASHVNKTPLVTFTIACLIICKIYVYS